MAKKPTTREMSDAHEAEIAALFGGMVMPGSGNQMANQMDVRQHHLRTGEWSFAFDGKSTLGKSVGVSVEMWTKAVEQAEHEKPCLPLRFFEDWRLGPQGHHLVVLDANDLAGLIEAARKIDAVKAFLNSDWMEGEIAYAADGPGAEQMIFERKLLAILND
jgi:hypothetical protein